MIIIWVTAQKLLHTELETENKAGNEEIWGLGMRDTKIETTVFAFTLPHVWLAGRNVNVTHMLAGVTLSFESSYKMGLIVWSS